LAQSAVKTKKVNISPRVVLFNAAIPTRRRTPTETVRRQVPQKPFYTAHSTVTVLAHFFVASRNIVTHARVYFYVTSLSLYLLITAVCVCAYDMLTHVRVNLSLMLSVTTDSVVM